VLQSNSDISCKKAMMELGYKARPIYESIADTARWFLENRLIKPAAQMR
jgi:nucleoside-diphosphate-sugar epimerase